WNAARNILHLYRIGHIIMEIPAAGRRGRKAGESVTCRRKVDGNPLPELAKRGENFKRFV
ncbi:hypothetical protein, partial [Streptomyces sp. NPDC002547]